MDGTIVDFNKSVMDIALKEYNIQPPSRPFKNFYMKKNYPSEYEETIIKIIQS